MRRAAALLCGALALWGCGASVRAPRVAKAYGELGLARLVLDGDAAGAAADLTLAIEFAPDDAQLYALRGLAHRRAGNGEAARADFKKAGSLDGRLKRALAPLLP